MPVWQGEALSWAGSNRAAPDKASLFSAEFGILADPSSLLAGGVGGIRPVCQLLDRTRPSADLRLALLVSNAGDVRRRGVTIRANPGLAPPFGPLDESIEQSPASQQER